MGKEINLNDIQKELNEGFKGIRYDFVRVDNKFEKLTEELNKKPDREESPQLLDKFSNIRH